MWCGGVIGEVWGEVSGVVLGVFLGVVVVICWSVSCGFEEGFLVIFWVGFGGVAG